MEKDFPLTDDAVQISDEMPLSISDFSPQDVFIHSHPPKSGYERSGNAGALFVVPTAYHICLDDRGREYLRSG